MFSFPTKPLESFAMMPDKVISLRLRRLSSLDWSQFNSDIHPNMRLFPSSFLVGLLVLFILDSSASPLSLDSSTRSVITIIHEEVEIPKDDGRLKKLVKHGSSQRPTTTRTRKYPKEIPREEEDEWRQRQVKQVRPSNLQRKKPERELSKGMDYWEQRGKNEEGEAQYSQPPMIKYNVNERVAEEDDRNYPEEQGYRQTQKSRSQSHNQYSESQIGKNGERGVGGKNEENWRQYPADQSVHQSTNPIRTSNPISKVEGERDEYRREMDKNQHEDEHRIQVEPSLDQSWREREQMAQKIRQSIHSEPIASRHPQENEVVESDEFGDSEEDSEEERESLRDYRNTPQKNLWPRPRPTPQPPSLLTRVMSLPSRIIGGGGGNKRPKPRRKPPVDSYQPRPAESMFGVEGMLPPVTPVLYTTLPNKLDAMAQYQTLPTYDDPLNGHASKIHDYNFIQRYEYGMAALQNSKSYSLLDKYGDGKPLGRPLGLEQVKQYEASHTMFYD